MTLDSQTTSMQSSIKKTVVILLVARTILDTSYRAAYPFLPFIAAGLGVSVASVAAIIQLRNLTGFLSPVFGPLTDRYGRRVMMLIGVAIAAVFGVGMYFVTSLPVAIAAFTIMGLSTTLYVPAQQAFLGDTVPYAQRGRVMAIAEVSWSLAAIVGLPLMGLVIRAQGWNVGYLVIGIFCVLAFGLIWFALPREERNVERATRAIGGSYGEALRAPMALAAIVTISLLAAANENINITYGAWMNTVFGLDAAALGVVALAIGGAELSSQITVAAFVDRIGKWKMVAGGLLVGGIAYLGLPLLSGTVWLSAVGLAVVFFVFELTIVASLPLISEIAPKARATLLSLGVAGFSLGRALGSFIAPPVFGTYGFAATSFVSAALIFAAFGIWMLWVREKPREVPVA